MMRVQVCRYLVLRVDAGYFSYIVFAFLNTLVK